MFEEPEWDILQPERSTLKEIPPAKERLLGKKTRVLKLLEQATEKIKSQENGLMQRRNAQRMTESSDAVCRSQTGLLFSKLGSPFDTQPSTRATTVLQQSHQLQASAEFSEF